MNNSGTVLARVCSGLARNQCPAGRSRVLLSGHSGRLLSLGVKRTVAMRAPTKSFNCAVSNFKKSIAVAASTSVIKTFLG